MVRPVVLLAVVVLAVGAVAGPAAAFVQPGPSAPGGAVQQQADSAGNATNATPGERLTGVVGVTEAEIEGDMANRTFGIRVARAETDAAKAAVVADQLQEIEQRLEALQERKERLEAARENGSISEGEYRAAMARTVAEINTAKRLTNATSRTAGKLSADVLAEKGVNASAIQTLRDRAANMTGPEVAEVARSIAGPGAGQGLGRERAPTDAGQRGPPGDGPGAENDSARGPPDDSGPGSDGDDPDNDGDGADNEDRENGNQ